MKLSIITPVYKGAKHLDKYLEDIRKQTSKNFELILVADTTNDGVFDVIQKHKKGLGKKLIVIYNAKRSSRATAIKQGALMASGEASIIITVGNEFDTKMVKTVSDLFKEKKTDIVEFKPKFTLPIRYSGKLRKSFDKGVVIEDHPEVNAFSYAFDFNKIFATEVLKDVARHKLPVELNSRYSIEITLFALTIAKTYSTANKVIITSKSKLSENFNPLKMIRQWDAFAKYMQNYTSLATTHRYTYNQYFTEAVFMSAFIKASKNQVISKKFNDKFKKQQESKFKNIFETNKYAQTKSAEISHLSKFTTVSTISKLHKEIG